MSELLSKNLERLVLVMLTTKSRCRGITEEKNYYSVPVNSRFTTNAASVFVLYLVGIMLYWELG